MNDRFKFRVWSIANKKYCHFATMDLSADGLLRVIRPLEQSEYIDDYENRYVIQQSTGLKDKSGKLIYEGDIVAHTKTKYTQRYIVNWNNKGFWQLDDYAMARSSKFLEENYEVIGNIYENKELLEDTECQK